MSRGENSPLSLPPLTGAVVALQNTFANLGQTWRGPSLLMCAVLCFDIMMMTLSINLVMEAGSCNDAKNWLCNLCFSHLNEVLQLLACQTGTTTLQFLEPDSAQCV